MSRRISQSLTAFSPTIQSIWNKVYSNYLSSGLSDILNSNKTQGEKPKSPVNTGDTIFDKTKGEPKQDLNKQPVPDYGAPTSAGFPMKETSSEYEFKSDENKIPETTTPPNTSGLGSNKEDYQSGVLKENEAIKNRNKELVSKLVNFYNTAGKFGEVGQKFQGDISTLLPLALEKEKEIPKFDAKTMQIDANGIANDMKWNGKTFVPVPILDASGKPMQVKESPLPDVWVVRGEDGNAWTVNKRTDEKKNTGYKFEDFDPQFGLKQEQLDWKKYMDEAKLEIQQLKASRKSGSTNDSGTNAPTGNNEDGYFLKDKSGNVIETEWRNDPVKDRYGIPIEGKTKRVEYIKGTDTPASQIPKGYQKLYAKSPYTREGQIQTYKNAGIEVGQNKEKEATRKKIENTLLDMLDKMDATSRDAWLQKNGAILKEMNLGRYKVTNVGQ